MIKNQSTSSKITPPKRAPNPNSLQHTMVIRLRDQDFNLFRSLFKNPLKPLSCSIYHHKRLSQLHISVLDPSKPLHPHQTTTKKGSLSSKKGFTLVNFKDFRLFERFTKTAISPQISSQSMTWFFNLGHFQKAVHRHPLPLTISRSFLV